jgi:hypothetical protein
LEAYQLNTQAVVIARPHVVVGRAAASTAPKDACFPEIIFGLPQKQFSKFSIVCISKK